MRAGTAKLKVRAEVLRNLTLLILADFAKSGDAARVAKPRPPFVQFWSVGKFYMLLKFQPDGLQEYS